MTIKRTETFKSDICQSCGDPLEDHLGIAALCAKWQSDKSILRGALRIIREAGLNVGSTELLEAARKEDEK